MRRIFINYHAKDNFGDDLFVKILCSYFGKNKFVTLAPKNVGRGLENISNLKIIDLKPRTAYKQYQKLVEKASACIYAGGTVFVEQNVNMEEYWDFMYMLRNKPLYCINPNFGPYRSNDFLERCREYAESCAGIWFRDKASEALFSGGNIKYMPDVSFAVNLPETEKPEKPYAVIAPVDLFGRGELAVLNDIYIERLRRFAELLKDRGYDIKVVAMCAEECDDKAAETLADYGDVIVYDGDINKILSLISASECVVASRMHAITCAVAAGKTIVPISYDNKINQALSDLDSEQPCFDVRGIGSVGDDDFLRALDYKSRIDISAIKAEIAEELGNIRSSIKDL